MKYWELRKTVLFILTDPKTYFIDSSELDGQVKFRIPDGGLAIWTEFNPDIDLSVLSQKAAREGLNVSDGKYFLVLTTSTAWALHPVQLKNWKKVFRFSKRSLNSL